MTLIFLLLRPHDFLYHGRYFNIGAKNQSRINLPKMNIKLTFMIFMAFVAFSWAFPRTYSVNEPRTLDIAKVMGVITRKTGFLDLIANLVRGLKATFLGKKPR